MIGIVIVAHGGLAREYLSAVEHVVGRQDGVRAISIEDDHDRGGRQPLCLQAKRLENSLVAPMNTVEHADADRDRPLERFQHLEKTDLLGFSRQSKTTAHTLLRMYETRTHQETQDLPQEGLRQPTMLGDLMNLR